jgi:hypothetical protein
MQCQHVHTTASESGNKQASFKSNGCFQSNLFYVTVIIFWYRHAWFRLYGCPLCNELWINWWDFIKITVNVTLLY